MVLFVNLFKHWMSNIPSSFNNFRTLNRGSVWAFYLLLVIILGARFSNLNNLLRSKRQHVILNCKCARMRESYINYMTEIGRYLLSLFITPRVRYFICNFRCMRIPINVFIYCDAQKIKRCNSFYICFANYQIWYFVCGDNSLIIMENHEFSCLDI